ncbi:MAG: alpha/beta hydrolase [Paracoccaceae bacterium]
MTIDPAAFDSAAVTAETAAFNRQLEATLAAAPKTHEVAPAASRAARAEGRSIFPHGGPAPGSEWREAPTHPGRVRVTPAPGEAAGVFIHIHGGGWTIGAADQADLWCQYLAREAGVAVVSIPYRLAPENPWPAPADDAEAGALWVLENAARLFGTDRIAIGGESAGAHLAAVTLGRLKARGLGGRIHAALMHYGVFDLAMTPSMANWGARQLILSTPTIAWFVKNLIAGDGSLAADAAASPIRADLSGMPPALFQCGTNDPLLDDTLFMAARWLAAGAKAELNLYPGGAHAFDMFDLAIAREARAAAARFLKARLAA